MGNPAGDGMRPVQIRHVPLCNFGGRDLDTVAQIGQIIFAVAMLGCVWVLSRRISDTNDRAHRSAEYTYKELDNIWRELSKREKSDAEKT
jgi:hypothetical protein